jgi:leader peptidase (prepilin peptidase)/N-methyltransferase
MGDVKLLGALGLLLGAYVLMVLFLGSIIGMIFGIASARGRKLSEVRLPFGPSLAGAAVVTALFGPWVWEAYLRLMGLV